MRLASFEREYFFDRSKVFSISSIVSRSLRERLLFFSSRKVRLESFFLLSSDEVLDDDEDDDEDEEEEDEELDESESESEDDSINS